MLELASQAITSTYKFSISSYVNVSLIWNYNWFVEITMIPLLKYDLFGFIFIREMTIYLNVLFALRFPMDSLWWKLKAISEIAYSYVVQLCYTIYFIRRNFYNVMLDFHSWSCWTFLSSFVSINFYCSNSLLSFFVFWYTCFLFSQWRKSLHGTSMS